MLARQSLRAVRAGKARGVRVTSEVAPHHFTLTHAATQGYVNAEVARHIDEVQIFEANKNLQQALAANDTEKAIRAWAHTSPTVAAKNGKLAGMVFDLLEWSEGPDGKQVSQKVGEKFLPADDVVLTMRDLPDHGRRHRHRPHLER